MTKTGDHVPGRRSSEDEKISGFAQGSQTFSTLILDVKGLKTKEHALVLSISAECYIQAHVFDLYSEHTSIYSANTYYLVLGAL